MFTPEGGVGVKSAFKYNHWHILLPDVGVAFSGHELAPPVYVGLLAGKMYCGVCAQTFNEPANSAIMAVTARITTLNLCRNFVCIGWVLTKNSDSLWDLEEVLPLN